jgi:flagellar hook-basal body complex protein FliE
LTVSPIGIGLSFPILPPVPGGNLGPASGLAENSFGAVLKSLTQGTVTALQNSEQISIDAIQGKASVQSAVMATMEAERSLQATLAIRDKLVSAFLEISRMQI